MTSGVPTLGTPGLAQHGDTEERHVEAHEAQETMAVTKTYRSPTHDGFDKDKKID